MGVLNAGETSDIEAKAASNIEKKPVPRRRYTIAVDFDGVLHNSTSQWTNAHTIPDPPVEGAKEWLEEMATRFDIVIHTTRARTKRGRRAVADYLQENGFPEPREITCEKIAALVYVDDRAWRFEGDNFPSVDDVFNARPWNRP